MVVPGTAFAASKADEQAEVRQAAHSALYKIQQSARRRESSRRGLLQVLFNETQYGLQHRFARVVVLVGERSADDFV